jgi:hypothetical protein
MSYIDASARRQPADEGVAGLGGAIEGELRHWRWIHECGGVSARSGNPAKEGGGGWDGKWWPRILARSSRLASGRTSSLPGFHDRLPRQSRRRCAGRGVQWRRRMSCRTLRKAEHDGRAREDLNPSPDALHPTQDALVQADEFLRRPRRCFRPASSSPHPTFASQPSSSASNARPSQPSSKRRPRFTP